MAIDCAEVDFINLGRVIQNGDTFTLNQYAFFDHFVLQEAILGNDVSGLIPHMRYRDVYNLVNLIANSVTVPFNSFASIDWLNIYEIQRGNSAIGNFQNRCLELLSALFPIAGFDPDYQAVLDYATTEGDTLPSAGVQEAQNTLVTDLKGYSIFSKLKELHIWRTGATGLGGFKSIDWVRLNKATLVNSPSLDVDGITGDGVSAYADLNFDASIETTLGDVTFGFWAVNGMPIGTVECPMGSIGAAEGMAYISNNSNRIFLCANSNLIQINNNIVQTELITVSSDGVECDISRNGVLQFSRAITTDGTNSDKIFALARNSGGTAIQHSSDTLAITFIANRLTTSELANMKTALDTYYATL